MTSHYQTETVDGLNVEYWREYNGTEGTDHEEYSEHVHISRVNNPDVCASLDFADDTGEFSEPMGTPLTPSEKKTVKMLWAKYY